MRYYLDTNILIFLLGKQFEEMDVNVWTKLKDYSSILYASNFAVQELLFLFRIGKLKYKKFDSHYKCENDILKSLIEDNGLEIVYFNACHFKAYKSLQIAEDHKDMNDHAIIAQAIADRIPLISSDHEFQNYTEQGLDFILNRR
ncbi:type II toxin-antitoxin system VapC family toxin [Limibacterium fermenti]|jgi:PIN domain nuclease of toxin-antitoxin system|uniref:type II toxin-antitoxin system VapC family toxin n=1 Tax=Limibacterium fermenti TaxID=3229863 RepID=UPI003A769DBA